MYPVPVDAAVSPRSSPLVAPVSCQFQIWLLLALVRVFAAVALVRLFKARVVAGLDQLITPPAVLASTCPAVGATIGSVYAILAVLLPAANDVPNVLAALLNVRVLAASILAAPDTVVNPVPVVSVLDPAMVTLPFNVFAPLDVANVPVDAD